jgi:flagellar assembly factor FliW
MKIETTRFGTITVEEDKFIHMPHGMLGFPDKRRFVMFQHREGSPFYWYQSVDDSALAFVITNPFLFKPDYEVDIEGTLEDMSWEKQDSSSLELYVVVNIPKDSPKRTTANLIGPILINNKTRQAVQMVVSDSSYSHKFPLIREG